MANRIQFGLGLILIALSCHSCHSKSFYADYDDGIEDSEFYSNFVIPNSRSQEIAAQFPPSSPQDQDKQSSGSGQVIVGMGPVPTVKRTQPEMIPEEFETNNNYNNNNNDGRLSNKMLNIPAENSWTDGESKNSQMARLGLKKGSLAGVNGNGSGFKSSLSRPVRRYRYRNAGVTGMKNSNPQRYLSAPSPSVFSFSSSGYGSGKSESSGFSKRQSILYRQCFFNPISCFRK